MQTWAFVSDVPISREQYDKLTRIILAGEKKMGLACDVTTQVIFDGARIPAAFESAEIEKPVLFDRPTHRAAKNVPVKFRPRHARFVIKETVG